MAYTAGQKVRATDLNTGLLAAVLRNATAVTGLRVAMGTFTASFSAISFSSTAVSYSTAGFTSPPVVIGVAEDGGSSGRLVIHSGTPTTTGTTLTALTSTATNITASIPIRWIAIGV